MFHFFKCIYHGTSHKTNGEIKVSKQTTKCQKAWDTIKAWYMNAPILHLDHKNS